MQVAASRDSATAAPISCRWQPNETNAKDERNFARSVPRRLPAEVAVDAVSMATLSDAKAATMPTELKGRAIAVAGAGARPSANNQNGNGTALPCQVFGRSIRESNCDCDRSMEASLLQTVFLQNDNQVLAADRRRQGLVDRADLASSYRPQAAYRWQASAQQIASIGSAKLASMKVRIERAAKRRRDKEQVERHANAAGGAQQKAAGLKSDAPSQAGADRRTHPTLVKQAYLRTLSRYPTADEMDRCTEYLAHASSPLDGAKGLLWTLINTKEFIVNH